MNARLRTRLTVTDQFCGAGGSSIGATAAGAELRLALNHWKLAIETHNSNFPEADHDCADISNTDPRRYESTDILLTSPECTNHTSAKGIARARQQRGLFDGPDPEAERSRATMWDVPRFAEFHGYQLIIVENVVEARRWVLWDAWWKAMSDLGYEGREVYLNSMCAPPTPQSRDRLYVVFWRKGNPAPDLDIRPDAWCGHCEDVVRAQQAFKRSAWGRYRSQYIYACPTCGNEAAPLAAPAATAIDWSLEAERIGDRSRPLKPATLKRIRLGLERYANQAMAVQVGGNLFARGESTTRIRPVSLSHATQTTQADRGLVTPPFITPLRTNAETSGLDEPVATVTAGGNHHGLVSPPGYIVGNYSPGWVRPVTDPLGTVTAVDHHALLVPYYGTGVARPTSEPMGTVTVRDRQALVSKAVEVEDCTFRMLQPEEILAAMAFPSDYVVHGNKRERVKQAGNAVTPPVTKLLLERCIATLEAA